MSAVTVTFVGSVVGNVNTGASSTISTVDICCSVDKHKYECFNIMWIHFFFFCWFIFFICCKIIFLGMGCSYWRNHGL